MAGPWEKYQNTPPASGPWEKYAKEPDADADMSFLGRAKDNFIGVDDGVESIGERIGTGIRGAGAAVARGMADVPAIPANLAQLATAGVEKVAGMEEPSAVSRALDSLPDTRDMLAAVPVIGEESKFRAPGKTGDFISTMGEFAGGAGMAAGPSAMVRYGAIPGAASEAAGQATEGTAAEPYARVGAGLLASIAAAPKPGAFKGNDEATRMANKLQSEGVRDLTVGQAKNSQPLMRMEGRLAPTNAQVDDFTASAMRQIGSAEKVATPSALKSASDAIVKRMDDAVKGVSVVPDKSAYKAAVKVASDYAERVPQGSLTPRIRGIANEIVAFSKSKKDVPLSTLKKWRSDIGKMTVSPDAATRDAAHGLRSLVDDMTDQGLKAAGRADDIANLREARETYRNFIGVRDAASRAGAEGGTLSPTQLNQSLIRAQGREAYATGRTTPMADFTRSGAAVLRPAPTVNPGGARTISEALPAALATGGAAFGYGAGMGVGGAAAAGIGAASLPFMGQALMRSNAVQSMMRNPTGTVAQSAPTVPGLLSQVGNN
ncbi:hypothetical protein ACGYLO_16610 [Sulfitobacter sp. 1A13353]|uniref:hypothetical protein n=1 Tax=Sulfitobacter sp. 1A13353 TaxID=3368568 RepID=UPI0037453DD6